MVSNASEHSHCETALLFIFRDFFRHMLQNKDYQIKANLVLCSNLVLRNCMETLRLRKHLFTQDRRVGKEWGGGL